MDPNDDNSLFTFINNLTSIPLQEKEDDRAEQAALAFAMNSSSSEQMITSGANSAANTFHSSDHHHQHLLLKRKFKGLNISGSDSSSSTDGLGSTATSEKSSSEGGCSSTSTDGSSNCSVSEQQQQAAAAAAHVESILSPLIGMMTGGGGGGGGGGLLPPNSSSSTAVSGLLSARESSESPANQPNHLHNHNLHSLNHFFGFQTSSNSNSSSPPLSQAASGASSSSASSGVLGRGGGGGGSSSEGTFSRNGLGAAFQPLLSTPSMADNHHNSSSNNSFSVFNNLASKMAFNSVQMPAGKGSEGCNSNSNSSFYSTSNPLDSMFSSFLNGSAAAGGGRGSALADPGSTAASFSSLLDGPTFPPPSSEGQRRQFTHQPPPPLLAKEHPNNTVQNGSFPLLLSTTHNQTHSSTNFSNSTAASQDSTTTSNTTAPLLSQAFFPANGSNSGSLSSPSYSPFSGNGKMVEGDFLSSAGLQNRKAFSSLFNGGSNNSSTNSQSNTASTSPNICSIGTPTTPQMLSAVPGTPSFFGTLDGGSNSNSSGSPYLHNNQGHSSNNNSHHQHTQMMSGNGHLLQHQQQQPPQQSNNNVNKSNVNMQARFEGHIRALANEINATVQLYTSSIEIRKEQLIKQLDHVRNTYLLLLKQHQQQQQQQNGGSSNKQTISNGTGFAFPRIHFARPDPSHLKVATSFGHLNSPAFAPYCHASGDGLSVAVEGEPACFVVTTRNCFNEEMLTGGESVEVEIQAIESGAPNHHHQQHPNHPNGYYSSPNSHSAIIQRHVHDNHSGKYSVTYLVPRGGSLRSLKVLVTVNGLPVASSPFLVTVKAERMRECWRRLALFGEEGTGPGKFCRPWGVALCRLPLVRDPGHKAVGGETVTSTPVQSKPFFSGWSASPVTGEPQGRQQRRDYVLAVADRSNNRIQLLKLSIGIEGAGGGGSFGGSLRSSPESISGGSNVDISVMHVFGSGPGTRNGQFDRPAGIAINGNLGQIVVVDKDNHRIQSFDMTGNFLFKFGEKGSRAGQFCYPWDVAICPQTSMVLVSDTRNRRIQLFTHFGQYLWHCGQPLDSPRGVAFLSPERYIVSDFNKHRLLIIDRNEGGGGGGGGHSSAGMLNGQSILSTLGPPSNGGGDSIATGINSKYIGFGEGSAWGEFLRPQGLTVSKTSIGGFGGGNNGGHGLLQPNHHHHHHPHNLHHLQQQHQYKNTQIICADSRNSRIAVWSSLSQSFEYIYEEPNASNSASSSSKSSEHNQQQQQSYQPGLMLNHSNFANSTTASTTSSSSSSSSAATTTAFDRPSGLAMVDDILAVVDFGNNRLQVFQRSVTAIN